MSNLVHAELLKLRTARTFYGNALAVLAFVPLTLLIAIQTAGKPGGGPALASADGIRNVMAAASSGALVVLIMGIMAVAGEFRHGTVTSTFLASPDRRRVVAAKLVATSIVGFGLAVGTVALTLAIALPWLAAKGAHVDVLSGDVVPVLLAAMAATVLNAVCGVGLGSLIRNQTTAIVVALLWGIAVEGMLVSFVPEVGRWLPGGAASALTSTATVNGGLLPVWGGGLVFAAYGLLFAAAGTRLVMQRDVA